MRLLYENLEPVWELQDEDRVFVLESGEILPEVTVIRDSVSGCLRMSAGKA